MAGFRTLSVPGPTNVPESVRCAIDAPMEDHRAPDFPRLTLPLFEDLKQVFKTRHGRPFLFAASGTGGWEAAISNTLSPGDRVLAARYGQFSELWTDMCRRHHLEVEVIDTEWGHAAPVDELERVLEADTERGIRAVLVCHNETATGVTSDVAAVRRMLDALDHPALLLVDGVSSIASIDFRMDDWGVDVAVCGSQKGFMMPAGLAVLCASEKAMAAAERAAAPRCYFDFAAMARANDAGYFPCTPPVTLLYGLRASLDRLFAEGLDNVFARHHRLAEGVRRAVAAWGLELCARAPRSYSDTVSAVVVPADFDARKVLDIAYHRYGLSLGGGLSRLAGRVFRIGHMGDFNELMALTAIAGSELAMLEAGLPIEAGSGTAAAQDFYRGDAHHQAVDLQCVVS